MVSVWLATVPETLLDIVPVGVMLENADEKALEPPDDAVPVTTRSVLSLWVVCLVQPVGAVDCWKSIFVPLAWTPFSIAETRPSRPFRTCVWRSLRQ